MTTELSIRIDYSRSYTTEAGCPEYIDSVNYFVYLVGGAEEIELDNGAYYLSTFNTQQHKPRIREMEADAYVQGLVDAFACLYKVELNDEDNPSPKVNMYGIDPNKEYPL